MDILLIAILLYLSAKRILDLLDIGIQWYAHYRDDKQAITKCNAWDAHKHEYATFEEFLVYYNKRGK